MRSLIKILRSKRRKLPSLSKLPDEILQAILEYASSDGVRLRLVCRRFNAIISSLLLSSITVYSDTCFRYFYLFKLQINDHTKEGSLREVMYFPISSHITHITIKLSEYENFLNMALKPYKRLLVRIIKYMTALKRVKLLHDLYWVRIGAEAALRTLVAYAQKRIPDNIHSEVELAMAPKCLDARSVSSQPEDWKSWGGVEYHFREEWPRNIDGELIDSLDIGADIERGYHPATYGLKKLARESIKSISNRHIFFLDRMVPGKFLSIQFPNGFPVHLKKLHLRHPLIINCTEILYMLRNCQHLKDLSLFVIFNMESHEHGLPPGLETLELLESGGTILPASYEGLGKLRYTFIGEPSDGHVSRVRQFTRTIPDLKVNVVSSSDFMEAMAQWRSMDIIATPRFSTENYGRYLLQSCDQFEFACCISKRAPLSLREDILLMMDGVRRP